MSVLARFLDRRRARTPILARQNCISGRRHHMCLWLQSLGWRRCQSNLMFVHWKEHQNRLNALLCLGKVGNMVQKVFAAIPMYLFCPLWCNGCVFKCLSSCQIICCLSLKTPKKSNVYPHVRCIAPSWENLWMRVQRVGHVHKYTHIWTKTQACALQCPWSIALTDGCPWQKQFTSMILTWTRMNHFSCHLPLGQNACSLDATMKLLHNRTELQWNSCASKTWRTGVSFTPLKMPSSGFFSRIYLLNMETKKPVTFCIDLLQANTRPFSEVVVLFCVICRS